MKSSLNELIKDMNRATHGEYVIWNHYGHKVTSQAFSFSGKINAKKDDQGRLLFHDGTDGYYITTHMT